MINDGTTIDDIGKVKIIRNAIASAEGWSALAQSVLNGGDFAKQECHRIFEIIAETSYNPEEWCKILTHELDRHIEEVKAKNNQIVIGGPNLRKLVG